MGEAFICRRKVLSMGKKYFYNLGDEVTNLTGGYDIYRYALIGSLPAGSSGVSKSTDKVNIAVPSAYNGVQWTSAMVSKNQIDFTDISEIRVTGYISSASSAGSSVICFIDNTINSFNSIWYQSLGPVTPGNFELVVNCSSITGLHYLKFGAILDGQSSYFINGYITTVSFS